MLCFVKYQEHAVRSPTLKFSIRPNLSAAEPPFSQASERSSDHVLAASTERLALALVHVAIMDLEWRSMHFIST